MISSNRTKHVPITKTDSRDSKVTSLNKITEKDVQKAIYDPE